jgi:peptidoglycan/LPS O-acetylase OafA/YrhL
MPSRIWVLVVVAIVSTLTAFVSHASVGPPSDHPEALLFAGGILAFAVGALRKLPAVVVGFAALAGFPIEATVDLVRHGGHDLLPFEFAFYAAYGLLGAVAARLGQAAASGVARLR